MRVISGFFTVGIGFCLMLFGILLGFTIIGLIWAFPVAAAGFAMMGKGMAEMGLGTYQAIKPRSNKSGE